MKFRIITLLFLFSLFPTMIWAQSLIDVTGTVQENTGEPLVGVTISLEDSSVGTTSDLDGHFKIKVPLGSKLNFTYVGYEPQQVTVINSEPVTVVMNVDTQTLTDVIVTALGIKRDQKALAYNAQTVEGSDLNTNKDANFINSLTGKIAGVTINASAGGSGSASRVIMRGTKSLTKDDNALYVIDGIPMFTVNTGEEGGGAMSNTPGSNSVADLNSEDIQSMTILTGPSAAALYGSDAASGVILITTKKGAEGKLSVTYSNTTQFSHALKTPKFQYIFGNNEGDGRSWGQPLHTPTTYEPTDFFRTGLNEINNISLTTGTSQNQTYASASITNSRGIIPNSDYNRYNFSIRNTSKFLKDKMILDLGAQYVFQNNKNIVGSGIYFNPLVSLYLFPRGENFNEVRMYERYDETRNIMTQYWPNSIYGTELAMQNPYWIQNRMNRETKKQRYMFNASFQYEILDWLSITARIRFDNSYIDGTNKYYASTNPTFTEGSQTGFYSHSKTSDRATYADFMVNLNKALLNERLSLDAHIGYSINDHIQDFERFGGGLNSIPNFFSYGNININQSKRLESGFHDQTQAIFASVELGWDSMLYLTLTGRNDWSSMLAYSSTLNYFYPSAGLSWIINQTFRMPQQISFLKIRGSWAEVASSPSRYLTLMQYVYNEQTGSYSWPSIKYHTDLKPENTKSYEFGLSARFFNILGLEFTYYNANTYNQTFYVNASASSGYSQTIVQTGNIRNRGIEATANYSKTWGDWRLVTGLTYTMNKNKIISLANGATNPETGETIRMDYLSKGTLGIDGGPTMLLYEGGTLGDLYTNLRLRQSNNGYIWRDPSSGNVSIETLDEYTYLGTTLPKFNIGWTATVGWKDLSLSWAVTGRFGGKVVSETEALLDRYGVSQRSAEARLNGGVPVYGNGIADAQNYFDAISSASGSYYIYSATNVRLGDITLTYMIPRSKLKGVADISLSLSGRNLFMIYCKAPFDPETTSATANTFYQGIDYFQQPSLRSYGFSIKLTF